MLCLHHRHLKKMMDFGHSPSLWEPSNYGNFGHGHSHTHTHSQAHTDALAQGCGYTDTQLRGQRLAIESNDTEILNYFFAVTMNATTTSGWQRRPPMPAATPAATATPAEWWWCHPAPHGRPTRIDRSTAAAAAASRK